MENASRLHAGSVAPLRFCVGLLNILRSRLAEVMGSRAGARSRGPQVTPAGRGQALEVHLSRNRCPHGLRWRDPAIAVAINSRKPALHSFLGLAHQWREFLAWAHARRRARRRSQPGPPEQGPTPGRPEWRQEAGKDPEAGRMASRQHRLPYEEELTLSID